MCHIFQEEPFIHQTLISSNKPFKPLSREETFISCLHVFDCFIALLSPHTHFYKHPFIQPDCSSLIRTRYNAISHTTPQRVSELQNLPKQLCNFTKSASIYSTTVCMPALVCCKNTTQPNNLHTQWIYIAI